MNSPVSLRIDRIALYLLVVAILLQSGISVREASAQGRATIGWSSVGPQNIAGISGKVNAFAGVRGNPLVLYVGAGWGNTPRESPSQSGIYRTLDGGKHWTAVDNGLTNTDGTVSSVVNGLWLDQAHPSVLLAATEFGGTFRSTDAGNSWRNVDRSESTQFAQVGSDIYVASARGVLRSTDDGATWSVSLPLTTGASTVATAAGATYAGSMAGDVYRLNGAWAKVGHPGTGPVHNLAIDPFNPAIVYGNVDDTQAWNQDLYGSINGGVTWTRVFCNCSIGAQAIAFSNVVKHRFYLGDDGSSTIGYFAADGSAHPVLHQGTATNGLDMRIILPVTGKTSKDDACYLLSDQGMYFAPTCSSGSASPALTSRIPNTLVYSVTVARGEKNIVAPLQDMSGGTSTDGGKSWHMLFSTGEGGEATLDPYAPQNCYFDHPDIQLLVSTDSCATFHSGGTGANQMESLTFLKANPQTVYGIGNADTNGAQVRVSGDGGRTFKPAGWAFVNPYQVAASPNDASTFVVATGGVNTRNDVYYTHDAGKSWHAATGLPTAVQQISIYFPTHRFFAAFDQNAPGTILLADHDPATDNILLYRSSDNGVSFAKVSTIAQPIPPRHWPNLIFPQPNERPAPEARYYATRFYGNRLAFNPGAKPSQTPVVVLTTRFGAFASSDVGSHWQRIDMGSIAHHFIGVAWDSGYVYLSSFGQGIVRTTAPLQ